MGHLPDSNADSKGKWHGVAKAIKKSRLKGGACLGPGFDQCCGVTRAFQVTLVQKNLPAKPKRCRPHGFDSWVGKRYLS